MKKTGLFLLGLTTGAAAAAYLAYRKMDDEKTKEFVNSTVKTCLLYTSDAADEL